MRRTRSLIFLALIAVGCGASKTETALPTHQEQVSTKADPWLLELDDSKASALALLWNGLIGVRLSRSGSGIGPGGKPLGFFMIDEYEPKGEEKLLEMPNPIIATWSVGNTLYQPNQKDHDFIKSGGTPLDPSGQISGS